MNIRDPKFNVGNKVIDKRGCVGTVIKVESYHLEEEEYWYKVSRDEGTTGLFTESYLKPYVEKPNSVWDLKEGDAYYVIDYDFMSVRSVIFFNDTDDLNYRYLGNCFLTKEEAEFALERIKIEAEMLTLGGRRKFKNNRDNCGIYRIDDSIYAKSYRYVIIQGLIYFDSIKEAEDAIKTIGEDRIKKYIFGVDE